MRSTLLGVLIAVALAAPAGAQGHPQTREGFWISFGLGPGSLGCDGCGDRLDGAHFYLKMGGTVSQRLLIGGEVNAWSKEEGSVTFSVANVGPVFYFYPQAEGGLFLKGGVGFATAELEVGRFSGTEEGAGVTLGVGWDIRVGRGFALTPYFDVTSSSFDGRSLNTVALGLGFTWP